jgi:hypothetical protein
MHQDPLTNTSQVCRSHLLLRKAPRWLHPRAPAWVTAAARCWLVWPAAAPACCTCSAPSQGPKPFIINMSKHTPAHWTLRTQDSNHRCRFQQFQVCFIPTHPLLQMDLLPLQLTGTINTQSCTFDTQVHHPPAHHADQQQSSLQIQC